MQEISDLFKYLRSRSLRIVLIPHANPDGDALGSALGLSFYLQKRGHSTQVISPNEYPAFLAWMSGMDQVLTYSKSFKECKKALKEADLLFFIDFSSIKRIGKEMGDAVAEVSAPRALIDHHPGQEVGIAQYRFWSSRAAASAQLVFDFICKDQGEALIDRAIAEALYVGILTDTGSFRFSSTTPRVHHIVARLIQIGNLDVRQVSERLYGSHSLRRMRFLGFALSECLFVHPDLYTAFFVLRAKDMRRFQPQTGDTEGLVNYALSIEGIRLAALIKELPSEVRLSFRSKGDFPANQIAEKHFSGGGHLNAAGGISKASLDEVVDQFKALLPTYKEVLSSSLKASTTV